MGEPVQQGGRHAFALEDLAPFAERQVAGDQQTGPFVPVREDLEQQLRPGSAEGQVAEFIADQKIHPVQLAQETVQLILLLRLLQTVDQSGRCEEPDPATRPAGRQAQGDRQMRLADALTAQQAEVLVLIEPLTAGQLHHLLLVHIRHDAEVVGIQILIDRERRLLDPRLQGIGRPLRRLELHQTQQVLDIMGVLLSRFLGQLLVFGQDRRQTQTLQMHL